MQGVLVTLGKKYNKFFFKKLDHRPTLHPKLQVKQKRLIFSLPTLPYHNSHAIIMPIHVQIKTACLLLCVHSYTIAY